MKTEGILSFIFLIIFLTACKSGQGIRTEDKSGIPAQGDVAEISFREYEHDFGKITGGEEVAHTENNSRGNIQ